MAERRGTQLVYRYAVPSQLRRTDARSELMLSTSGGMTETGLAEHPYFFTGFLTEPAPAALGMLACAAVARSRYFTPQAMLAKIIAAADPVVTSNGDRLRFESFSACCGVHARLDLLPDALQEAPKSSGTTNVDFNAAMRAALSGATAGGPLLLSVGAAEVTVTTLDDRVTERKVPLPGRWLKGFGEVQALTVQMRETGALKGAEVQRFIRSIPRNPSRPLWVVPAAGRLTLTAAPRPGAACLAAPHRLAELAPLLSFARGLRIYSAPADARPLPMPSAWELDLGTARFTLTLSPEKWRGFSGEGALLGLLADQTVSADAEIMSMLLRWDPRIDVGRLSAEAAISSERAVVALTQLATTGRVGYDLAEQSFFHRELPFGPAAEKMRPRLADARALVEAGAVVAGTNGALVRSGTAEHRVTFATPHDLCTCPWWGKHQGTRGPCKHVLAARIAARP
jgi:hypothetical protein